MLRWFTKVAAIFLLTGVAINASAIFLSGRSFELTARNWSLAIGVTIIGTVVTAAAVGLGV